MPIATITVRGDGQIWRGSLREFFRINEYGLAEAKQVIADIRRRGGKAIIGGGAAPPFFLRLAARTEPKPGAALPRRELALLASRCRLG